MGQVPCEALIADVWMLVAAAVVVVVSWFLLMQGVAFQRWATWRTEREAEDEKPDAGQHERHPVAPMGSIVSLFSGSGRPELEAPDPDSGIGACGAVLVLAGVMACLYALTQYAKSEPLSGEVVITAVLDSLLLSPETNFSLALAASTAPAFVGLFKFSVAYFMLRRSPTPEGGAERSPLAALAGGALTVLYIAGAVASLAALAR